MPLPLPTQPTLPINYYLINLHVMSHTIKLLKWPFFSAVLLCPQLPLVLYRNNQNIRSIPITIPVPKHIPSISYH